MNDPRHPNICVVGRTAFESGIGRQVYSACEMLARAFPICVMPTDPHARAAEHVVLPNGRVLPVCRDAERIKVWWFVDVLWNGVADRNYTLVGKNGLRIAQIAFDSDELPFEWVSILNERFDVVFVLSPYLVGVAQRSGVSIPVDVLPVALDLDEVLSRPCRARNGKVTRFVSVSAFHPRKDQDLLVRAFAAAFVGRSDVELVIHSNLSFGGTLDKLRTLVDELQVENVRISHSELDPGEVGALIDTADVFVNCSRGEGFSIGAREALALGKALVLSRTGAHLDLLAPGIVFVEPSLRRPARYPEIDNRIVGAQYSVEAAAIAPALVEAADFVASDAFARTAVQRRRLAGQSSFSRLWLSFASVVDTEIAAGRGGFGTAPLLAEDVRAAVTSKVGRRARGLDVRRNCVVPAHDGGFFSVFNSFLSHLAWNARDPRCGWTLPDWDVGRLLERSGGAATLQSFCYGRVSDGNLWGLLYEPLPGTTAADLNDVDVLYGPTSSVPGWRFNEHREPLLTYVHAHQLYRTPDFQQWRRWYGRVYREQVRLLPQYQTEIDRFAASRFGDRFMIAAHVRHPSHAIEQPGQRIALLDRYIDLTRAQLRARNIDPEGSGWGLFVATDQDASVLRFREAFGEHVFCFDDVRRTTLSEDAAYADGASDTMGHQVQHITAADPTRWSIRMAWEVIRDAEIMARCDVLLHVVSNISTAVSYMNPRLQLVSAY